MFNLTPFSGTRIMTLSFIPSNICLTITQDRGCDEASPETHLYFEEMENMDWPDSEYIYHKNSPETVVWGKQACLSVPLPISEMGVVG